MIGKKFYIDPGHGGKDAGATGVGGYTEAPIVLEVAKFLKAELLRQGAVVKMCREDDTEKTMAERVAEANSWGADFYISIHANWWKEASTKGTETYVYQFGGQAEALADLVQPLLVATLDTEDRKVKDGNLYVLRKTKAPAILCELGFMTNWEDLEKLIRPENQKAVAVAICKGACAYYGVAYKEEVIEMEFKDQKSIPKWAKDAVDRISDQGLMIGDDQGNFRPNDPITRAELAVVLDRLTRG